MPANLTDVEFVGPIFITYVSYTDYHFICRLTLTASVTSTVFDVALTFDGQLDPTLPVKTTTGSELEVIFTADDFGQHFGQMVRHVSHYVC